MIFQKGGSRPAIPCSELVFPPLTFLFFKGAPWRNGKMPICKKDGQADQPVRLFLCSRSCNGASTKRCHVYFLRVLRSALAIAAQ